MRYLLVIASSLTLVASSVGAQCEAQFRVARSAVRATGTGTLDTPGLSRVLSSVQHTIADRCGRSPRPGVHGRVTVMVVLAALDGAPSVVTIARDTTDDTSLALCIQNAVAAMHPAATPTGGAVTLSIPLDVQVMCADRATGS